MKVDVSSIMKHPGETLPFELAGKLDAQELDDVLETVSPLMVRGVATSIGNGVYVQANVKGTIDLICSRCLSPFRKNLNLNCEAKYVDEAAEDEEKTSDDEDVETYPLDGTYCHLDEMIRSEILLSLPMKPLCRPDCKGICPSCGKNLNEGPCGCDDHADETTLFGEKLMEALKERGKQNGRS